MANLFETFESALQGNGLSGALTAVTGGLSGVSSVITGSGSNPPKGVADFGPALRSLSLPDLDVSSAFGSSFASVKDAVPSDLSSITGGLTSGIGKLKDSGGDLGEKLGESLKVVQAVYQLTQIDFSGSGSASATATGAGTGTGTGSGGGAATGTGAGTATGTGTGTGAGTGAGTPPPPPPVSAQSMAQVNSALDGLPSPLTLDSFLTWLQQVLAEVNLDDVGLRQIAFIGDLRDYLATLLNWKNADPAAIRGQLADTLSHLDAFLKGTLDPLLSPLNASATALAGKLHADTLAQIADGIQARLAELKTPVNSGSLSGAGASITALSALLDQYDQLKTSMQTDLGSLPSFQAGLRTLPDDIEDQVARAVSVLRPSNSLAVFDQFAAEVKGSAGLATLTDDLSRFLDLLVSWITDLIDKINFKVLTQPLQDAANAMKSVVDSLDSALADVQLQVQQIFGKVESVLNLLDPAAATAQVKAAIDSFKADIVKKVSDLLKPAMDAITNVVNTIANGVQKFDPKQLEAVLHDAFQKVAGVLSDPRIAEVRKALDDAANQLDAVSFAPFTDKVVQDMQGIADQLKSLGDLPSPLGDALHAALSVLPADLQPITDPILDEFGKIVNAGPVQVLNTVADLPKQLADKIRAFDPTSVISNSLSGPYNKLLADMQGFKPSSLLQPVRTELNSFKDRLAQNVSPGKALQGLQGPFQELSKAFDSLHPDEIIAPLDAKLKDVLGGITAAVPLDDVFSQVTAVVQRVKSSVDTAASTTAALDKTRGILRVFANPQAGMDAWLAPIMTKLDNLGDTSVLQTSLASVSSSVNGLTAASISSRCDAVLAPVASALDSLDPQKRWATIVLALQGLPASAVDALPSSAQKSALKAALARLDTSSPAVSAPFVSLAGLRQGVTGAKAALQSSLADWDARYTAADTALGSLRGLEASPAHLKQWIHDAATDEMIAPLTAIFSLAAPALAMLDAVVGELQKLVNDLEGKMADLLAGVTALTSIRDSLNQLLDHIKNFNLGFLRDSLKDAFAQLRAKLDAINPANLGKALDAIFKDVLDSLSIDLFLPAADVAKIDSDYAKLVDTLKALDPAKVLGDVIQTEFQKDVLPLLDALDMSAPLHKIADRLSSLAAELKTELDKVEQAFEAMLASVPSGGGAGASLSAGVSLG